MRYAVIGDIHGNLPALQAALADAKAHDASQLILLGDYHMCLPWPNEVVELLRKLPDACIIGGNEEEYLRQIEKRPMDTWTDGQFQALYQGYRDLTIENREYLKSLPTQTQLTQTTHEGIIKFHIAHGMKTFLGNDMSHSGLSSVIALHFQWKGTTEAELDLYIKKTLEQMPDFHRQLLALNEGIYLFAHSHVQFHYESQGRLLINPGSVWIPLDGIPHGSYTLLDVNEQGFRVTERRLKIDPASLIKKMKASSVYEVAPIWCDMISHELDDGFEHVQFFLKHVAQYADSIGDHIRPYSKATWEAAYRNWEYEKNYLHF